MARKVSTGKIGGPILGAVSVLDNEIVSLEPNADLDLSPNGNGSVNLNGNVNISTGSTLFIGSNGCVNGLNITAPASMSSNVNFRLPNSNGTSGYVLVTDGSGNLSYDDIRFEVATQNTSGTTYYPMLTTSTSGTITGIDVSNNKLTYTPSTGQLNATTFNGNLSSSSVNIDGGNIDGTTIGSASAAAGTFTTLTATSITETSSIAYKENVNPITDALSSILELVGVTYDRKDGSSVNEAGLIAEETAKVLPNLVTYKDGKPEGINYTKLSAYLIEAIKDLSQQIKDLKEK